ncbi:NUDIX domain-containing protein [Aneurinibacillus migulanus]|jgi:8-oxo-dGTP diphosphatase|uniref:ADP-ribose pyrophosphatase YjhB, NUDIX family n=1 Tax=Aneurinibacillus migulanus TaxID=47500 RepID=A0A0D1XPH3_ANEMI|nr:NUDIX domain-containing protein [Aneurinibacillus migulanus]KIV54088.1 NUDIX hydrolase [Aneurinibacillus migulanus]KON97641.1 NUDIX hydrolase [Aneurinibacillus migulanus]MED0894390.1 NUDIX domain-containing protein [Aneurinibacillus migulanus]MED1617000.1 NUDIX domain-containing protein [Aneurinibacillus migulanus]SDJ36764.1 ADP-ribose pyrophosphatase YjhB, NUDIX family [Aneurinibacillus migulanus]
MDSHIRVRAGAIIIENQSILLVEFNNENGLHYNLPGGGVEPNETVIEAVRRESKEEASIDVEVGPLAFVYEYAPHLNSNKYGSTHSLGLMFECQIKDGFTPSLPNNPDPNQTDVKWIPLSKLQHIDLYPNIRDQIVNYAEIKKNIDLIEEHTLEEYIK